MSVEFFHYAPLMEGQIRLLTLRRGSDQDEGIECGLYTCELDRAPPYEALSYTWGSPHTTRTISVGSQTFQTRENLYNALRCIRRLHSDRLLWIDALCINMPDIKEKSYQVSRIADIYTKARNVVVYLDEATDATDQVMDYLNEIEKMGESQIPPKIIEGSRDLLSRPWFQWIWILQEVVNAQELIVYCGSRFVSSKTFACISELSADQSNHLSREVLKLMTGSRRNDGTASRFPLYDLLQRFKHAKAVVPRDKIFALLGIVDFGNSRTKILPDYSMSEADVMRAVLAHLCFCEPSGIPELPYETIDEFLSDLDPIDSYILEKILEFSQDIDLESLIRHGSHYIRIDHSLVEAASRNATRGMRMVELLLREIGQKTSGSPGPSEASSVFSDISTPSTNTSYPSENIEISVWHVVEILLTQHAFADLCQGGFQREDFDLTRFANNLRRMLKAFGKKLLNESQSYSTRLTAQLILGGSRRIAALIRARYDPSYARIGSKLIESNLDSMKETERRARIETFIQQLISMNPERPRESPDVIEYNSDSDDDIDSDLQNKSASISSLDEIESFILLSKAFESLLDTLRIFLKFSERSTVSRVAEPSYMKIRTETQAALQTDFHNPLPTLQEHSSNRYPTALPDLEMSKDPFWTWLYERLSQLLIRVERPEEGLHRIQYTCGCGEPMLADVKELKPGGLERFQNQLQASLAGPHGQILPETGAMFAEMPAVPQQAYVAGSHVGEIPNLPQASDHAGPVREFRMESDRQQTIQIDDVSTMPRYLLLCVNTRNLTKLIHVDLTYIENDQFLFDGIRSGYWEARRHESWHYGLLTPQWLINRMPSKSEYWLQTLHLRVPRSAELIQFKLMPYPTKICPYKIKLGLPPEYQVKVQKNYHYDPCPADVEVLRIPKFSHLLKPGFHAYRLWWMMFPKKLHTELEDQPGIVGWGLIIHEGWDWVVLLSSMFGLMVLVGVAIVLYAIFSHDPASAFGFGAYVVAVITLVLTLKYWAWQDREFS